MSGRLKSEIKCFEFSLGNGEFNFGIPLSYLLSYPVGYGILTSRDWKGTARNEEHWVFSLSFLFSPSLSPLFSSVFSRCLDESSVFWKAPCQSFREIVYSRWWRNSIAHEESSKFLEGRTPSFPRCTVIRWFSRIPGEVFLRFEETVSGFPQHLRRTREGDTERTKRGSTRRHRPSFLSLATTSTYACHRLYFIFPKDCVCFVGTRDVFVNIRLWNLVLKRKRWRLVPWTVGFLFYFVFRSFWKIIHQGKRCVKIGAFIYWDKIVFSILW